MSGGQERSTCGKRKRRNYWNPTRSWWLPDPITESRNDTALQKLDKKGHEIKELDYNVSAREFPKVPEAPQKEQLSEPTEYEQAVQTFE